MKAGKIYLPVAVAALIWFYMFSPWTAGTTNFWITMAAAGIVLTAMTFILTEDRKELLKAERPVVQVFLGIAIAFVLWGVFWLGNEISSRLFGFARGEVESVYAMKGNFSPWVIALLLLFVIGPAEELFWRGYVQRSFMTRMKPFGAFIVTTLIYALVHIWSMNFMLVMAALVAGAVWGLIYCLKPNLLPALVVCHALWDALVFIIFPI